MENSHWQHISEKTKAVDSTWGTKGVAESGNEIGLLEFLKYFTTDHRGLLIDLCLCRIFSGLLHPLQSRESLRIQTKSKS
eukprot:11256989-Ditylum_brightwellii.AAC.1